MPRYDYRCALGHVTERVAGYEDRSILCRCGDIAYRQAVYRDQFTITETGAVYGARDRQRRNHLGDKLEDLRKNSASATKESGTPTGPFKLPESKTYGPS